MTVSTFYSNTADGRVSSYDATYATARAGAALNADSAGSTMPLGQFGTYNCYESFISFDTSTIGTDEISSATLSLYAYGDNSVTDFTCHARLKDWGASVTTADWVAGADLSSLPLLASVSTLGLSTSSYTDFTSESAFLTNINKTGTTGIILSSSRHEAANAPTNNEFVVWYTADQGGSFRPKLVVVHGAATTAVPVFQATYRRRR
jgi:hypothetical protein